jgi:hypothetical protein
MRLAACSGLFIDPQNLIGVGASLNLALVEVRHLFQRASSGPGNVGVLRWQLALTSEKA